MSPRHDRKRPGGHTPVQLYAQPEGISVARLEPEEPDAPAASPQIAAVPPLTPEPPAPAAVPAPVAAATAPAPAQPQPQPAASTTQQAPVTSQRTDPSLKIPTTVQVQLSLKKQAETAVKTTGHLPGGHKSWAQFVNAAVARELQRLADEFNDGEPFPENAGEFRNGRPLGS